MAKAIITPHRSGWKLKLPHGWYHAPTRNEAGETYTRRRHNVDHHGRSDYTATIARALARRDPLHDGYKRYIDTPQVRCPCCGQQTKGKARLNAAGKAYLARHRYA